MTPQRWQQVNEVFHSALECDPHHRASFLGQVCAGDEDLRREVESLIHSHEQDGSFINAPSVELADESLADDQSELAIGETISHYTVIKTLGAGGMGKVYLAHDDLLNRKVAIKLLPSSLNYDKQLRARFLREAQLASALDHPNICTVYEVGEPAATRFIVMQYVEGETLKQVIGERPLPVDRLLSISLQMADALAAAHSQGIIHRDIKPSNIIITPRGQVKVLDFGLAKLLEGSIAVGDSELTHTGAMLGTPSYMSPEQARGERVDARSDIFSFGLVMYQMATGRLAFKGDSPVETMNAVINEPHPPVGELSKEVPARLAAVIDRALAKEVRDRYQSVEELVSELRQAAQSAGMTSSSVPYIAPRQPRATGRLQRASSLIGLAVVLALVFGIVLWIYFSRNTTRSSVPAATDSLPSMKVVPFTSFPGREDQAAFSPDGNQIAFGWDGEKGDNPDIYVKSIGGDSPLRLTSDPAAVDIRPTWSPDGQRIAFVRIIPSENRFAIFTVPSLGTARERELLSLNGEPYKIVWSPDGKFIAFTDASSNSESHGIVLFSPETGEKRTLTSIPATYWADHSPAFSPDSQTLAFVRSKIWGRGDIHTVPIIGGEPTALTFDNAQYIFDSWVFGGLAWTADGSQIIFSSNRGGIPGLWRIPVSGGTPERLGVGGDNAYYPSISREGNRLAYTQLIGGSSIYRTEMTSSSGRAGSPTKLVASTRAAQGPQYSPDGKRIAFESDRSGNPEIWMCDSEGLNLIQLTSFGGGYAFTPRWSPDGKQIAFSFGGTSDFEIYVVGAEGGGPRRITTEGSDAGVPAWSHDGRYIYFTSNRGGDQQVWKVSAEGGTAVQVTKQGGFTPLASVDGKHIYYSKGSSGRGVWRVSVEGGEETLVLDQPGAGDWGSWALVESGIYFINLQSKGGPAVEFFSFAGREIKRMVGLRNVSEFVSGLAVSPDRRWILYTQQDPIRSDIMLVNNFR